MKKILNVIAGAMFISVTALNVSCKCSDDRDQVNETNGMVNDTVTGNGYDMNNSGSEMRDASGSSGTNTSGDNNYSGNNDGVITTSDTVPKENIVPSGGSKGEARYSSSGDN